MVSEDRMEELITEIMTSRHMILDIAKAAHQKVRTTKYDRRLRAFAYLLDTFSSEMSFVPTEQEAIDWINIIEELRPRASQEAVVAFDRVETRLRHALSNPGERLADYKLCTACGDTYQSGVSHTCTNKSAIAKNAAMMRDDTVM